MSDGQTTGYLPVKLNKLFFSALCQEDGSTLYDLEWQHCRCSRTMSQAPKLGLLVLGWHNHHH